MSQKAYKEELLSQLYQPHKDCTACPLGHLGRTNIVFGQGNPNAKLMLIGEGPGRDEDIQGKPFVGRSGKLLDRIFEGINLKREEIFITNIVKCRPPNNRKPTKKESSICKKLLLFKQIKIIRPKVICTLGTAAAEALLEKPVKITTLRGKPFELLNTIIIPTYHPAYILRNPKMLKYLIQDLSEALKRLQ